MLKRLLLTTCTVVIPALQVSAVPIEFVITIPENAPIDSGLFLAGNVGALGGWRANGLRVSQGEDGRYRKTIDVPVGTELEFKVTCGSWATVERDEDGGQINNRRHRVTGPATLNVVVASFPDPSSQSHPDHTLTGIIHVHYGVRSDILDNNRDVLIYLPPGYHSSDARYPVLYMHDGQNVFDAATSTFGQEWQADEHAEKLINAGTIQPVIIVAVDSNADRTNEMTPNVDPGYGRGGKGAQYARFFVDELKPFIDAQYRTKPDREHTAIAGASAGGLISLYMCTENADVFGQCGIVSPALMWNRQSLLKSIEKGHARKLAASRLWIDMGTAEVKDIKAYANAEKLTRRLTAALEKVGLTAGKDFRYEEIEGGRHNEKHWADRFDEILVYFYGR